MPEPVLVVAAIFFSFPADLFVFTHGLLLENLRGHKRHSTGRLLEDAHQTFFTRELHLLGRPCLAIKQYCCLVGASCALSFGKRRCPSPYDSPCTSELRVTVRPVIQGTECATRLVGNRIVSYPQLLLHVTGDSFVHSHVSWCGIQSAQEADRVCFLGCTIFFFRAVPVEWDSFSNLQ